MTRMNDWIKKNSAWLAAIIEDGAEVPIDHGSPPATAVIYALKQAQGSANAWIAEIEQVIRNEDNDGLDRLIRRLNAKKLGQIRSPARARASRRNGRLGGKPKKTGR